MEVKGSYVDVIFDGRSVHFKSKKIDRDYAVAQIASVDYKPATLMSEGYIHFRAAGDVYKVGRGPNAAHFGAAQNSAFLALATAVRAAMASPSAAVTPEASGDDVMSKLRQLAELRDAGIVTSDEFEAKKAELLSRL
jgi:hypothetical protein